MKDPEVVKKMPDLNTKQGRYFIAKQKKGMTKKKAAIIAGYADGSNISKIEKSKGYKELEKVFFKDELLKQISLENIATELIKNIEQDSDRGAKNKAIDIALSKLEDKVEEQNQERVLVILQGDSPALSDAIDEASSLLKNN